MPSLRRVLAGLPVGVAALALALAATAPSASADPMFPVNATVVASTHIAKTGMNVTVPPGSFTGAVDLATGAFNGRLSLPPAAVTIKLLGAVPLVDATFAISPGPISGHVNFANLSVTTSSTFHIRITNLSPHGTNVNLVGSGCTTSKPITVTMSGVFSLTASSTFSGTYTIPTFGHCDALTIGLNQLIPGPGNAFSATFVPQGGALPTTTTTTAPSLVPPSLGVSTPGSLNVGAGDDPASVPPNHNVQAPPPVGPAPSSPSSPSPSSPGCPRPHPSRTRPPRRPTPRRRSVSRPRSATRRSTTSHPTRPSCRGALPTTTTTTTTTAPSLVPPSLGVSTPGSLNVGGGGDPASVPLNHNVQVPLPVVPAPSSPSRPSRPSLPSLPSPSLPGSGSGLGGLLGRLLGG